MKIWMLIQDAFSGRTHLQGWLIAGVMFFVVCCGQLLASDDGTKQGGESPSKKYSSTATRCLSVSAWTRASRTASCRAARSAEGRSESPHSPRAVALASRQGR